MAKSETFTKYLNRDCYIHYEYTRTTHFWSGKVEYSHRLWMYNQSYPIPHILSPQCDVINWSNFFVFLNRKWIYSPSSYRSMFKSHKHIIDTINGFKFDGATLSGNSITLKTRKESINNGDIVIADLSEKTTGLNSCNSDWELSLYIHGKDTQRIILNHFEGCKLADLIAMGFTYNLFKQRYEKDFYLVLDESIIDIAVKCNDIKD